MYQLFVSSILRDVQLQAVSPPLYFVDLQTHASLNGLVD